MGKLLLTSEVEIALLLLLGLPIAMLPLPSYANDVTTPQLKQAQFEYEYVYVDPPGNRYIIARDSIDYQPMTRMRSSSGLYDGGKPRKVTIDTRQYQEIAAMLDRAFNTTSNFDGKVGRTKGTGLIYKPDKNRQLRTSRILDMHSPQRAEIEALLKKSIDR